MKTAVQWLVEKLEIFATEEEMNIIDQAKEMEKQQIINAYTHDRFILKITAEQYYNETFKTK